MMDVLIKSEQNRNLNLWVIKKFQIGPACLERSNSTLLDSKTIKIPWPEKSVFRAINLSSGDVFDIRKLYPPSMIVSFGFGGVSKGLL